MHLGAEDMLFCSFSILTFVQCVAGVHLGCIRMAGATTTGRSFIGHGRGGLLLTHSHMLDGQDIA